MAGGGIRIDSDGVSHSFTLGHRDFMLLSGPSFFIPHGSTFIQALGIYENFTVSGGIPRDSGVRRRPIELHAPALALLYEVSRQEDLLGFDYCFSFSSKPKQRHSASISFPVGTRSYVVSAQPKGFCTLEILEAGPGGIGRPTAIIDLRSCACYDAGDRGELRVHRRKAELKLVSVLEGLVEFLSALRTPELSVFHL